MPKNINHPLSLQIKDGCALFLFLLNLWNPLEIRNIFIIPQRRPIIPMAKAADENGNRLLPINSHCKMIIIY